MLPRGLDRICVSTRAWLHKTNAVLDGVVRESSITETNVGPPSSQLQLWCQVGYIHIHIHSQKHYLNKLDWMLNSSWKELNRNMQSSKLHVLKMASSVSQVSLTPAPPNKETPSCAACRNYMSGCWSCSHLFSQLCQSQSQPPPKKKIVGKKSKWHLTLTCSTTATYQRWFGGQHGVLNDIGGLENCALLWTRVRTITEKQPKW